MEKSHKNHKKSGDSMELNAKERRLIKNGFELEAMHRYYKRVDCDLMTAVRKVLTFGMPEQPA